MPASAIVTPTISADTTATSLLGIIGERYWPHSVAEMVRLSVGASPSYALIKIPLKQMDDTAPSVAGVSGSPKDAIKHGQAAYVMAVDDTYQVTLFDGVVTAIEERWSDSEDWLLVKVEDERERMRKWPIIGSFWASGEIPQRGYAYRQGWAFRPNANGQPNCLWRTIGDEAVPLMCTPWYGVPENAEPPADTVASQTQACYWTSDAVLKYLRFIVSSTAYSAATDSGFTDYPEWPSDKITWPNTLEAAIENDQDEDRRAKDVSYDGMSLLGALQSVIASSGPYSLFITPEPPEDAEGTYTSALAIVRTRYAGEGVTLIRPTSGDAATALAKPRIVLAGGLRESAVNLYTKIIVGGELVFIERRVQTGGDNSGDLSYAWDGDAEEAWRQMIEDRINAGDAQDDAIDKANRQYPHVACTYRLRNSFDALDGTTESDRTHARVPRPIANELLSSYLEASSSSPSIEEQRHWRRPILFEYQAAASDPDDDPWLLALQNDGLEVRADGTIWLPGLRDYGTTYTLSTTGSVPNKVVTVAMKRLRATVAIPADHRLTASRKMAVDDGSGKMTSTPGPDDHRIETGVNYTLYEKDNSYGYEERSGAWPVPETVDGSVEKNDVIRNDADQIASHAERRARDFARIEKPGSLMLPNLMTTIRPGLSIAGLDNGGGADDDDLSGVYPLKVVVQSMTFVARNQDSGQYVECEVM